jgi:hypothetical protein
MKIRRVALGSLSLNGRVNNLAHILVWRCSRGRGSAPGSCLVRQDPPMSGLCNLRPTALKHRRCRSGTGFLCGFRPSWCQQLTYYRHRLTNVCRQTRSDFQFERSSEAYWVTPELASRRQPLWSSAWIAVTISMVYTRLGWCRRALAWLAGQSPGDRRRRLSHQSLSTAGSGSRSRARSRTPSGWD